MSISYIISSTNQMSISYIISPTDQMSISYIISPTDQMSISYIISDKDESSEISDIDRRIAMAPQTNLAVQTKLNINEAVSQGTAQVINGVDFAGNFLFNRNEHGVEPINLIKRPQSSFVPADTPPLKQLVSPARDRSVALPPSLTSENQIPKNYNNQNNLEDPKFSNGPTKLTITKQWSLIRVGNTYKDIKDLRIQCNIDEYVKDKSIENFSHKVKVLLQTRPDFLKSQNLHLPTADDKMFVKDHLERLSHPKGAKDRNLFHSFEFM